MSQVFDVAIIGGGINGCGIAADASLRGLSVILFEEHDIASQTSSKSTKLIHGGLRYLEYFDFSLVKKALGERQTLLKIAPHLIKPIPIVIPYLQKIRPIWLIRLGLFIYDHLSPLNKLPLAKYIKRNKEPQYFTKLNPNINKGLIFYDCATDDARLTLANALLAKEHGAKIMPHTKLINAKAQDGKWILTLLGKNKQRFQIKTKVVINCAGPWVNEVSNLLKIPNQEKISLVKGSHIVLPKLDEGLHGYMLENKDKRIIFALPFYDHTLVGTTEIPFSNDFNIEEQEINYLLKIINQYFNKKIEKKDIVDSWSGVRTLIANNRKSVTALSRDYAMHLSTLLAPSITVYGGKLTTYRQLAEETVNLLTKIIPNIQTSTTAITLLPGAKYNEMDFENYQIYAKEKYIWLDPNTLNRYLKTYGTYTEKIIALCEKQEDLGLCFAETLYQKEIDYLIKEEWATCSDDILWRRTKIGLTIDDTGKKALEDYLCSIMWLIS